MKFRRVEQAIEQSVHTRDKGEGNLAENFHKTLHVARVGDQYVDPSYRHEYQAVRGQCKDMIKRQCRDNDLGVQADAGGNHPGLGLLHIGHQVAVRQHGALGYACRAPGILQESQVVMTQVYRGQ